MMARKRPSGETATCSRRVSGGAVTGKTIGPWLWAAGLSDRAANVAAAAAEAARRHEQGGAPRTTRTRRRDRRGPGQWRGARVLQVGQRVADVAQAFPRIALEAAGEQPSRRGRSRFGQRAPVHLGAQHPREHVAHRLAREEPPAGEHLVEHDAEGPDVGALVDGLAAGLLGRHVGGGAEDQAGGRAGVGEGRGVRQIGGRGVRAFPRLGEAEVEHFDLAVGRELDVGGLEVAVDDALLVRFLERRGDLRRDLARLGDGDRAALQALGEVLALDELQREQLRAEPSGSVTLSKP